MIIIHQYFIFLYVIYILFAHTIRLQAGAIKGNSIQFSDVSVLALKATNEGPRRILIVASRNQPISIRDAQTGLFLRTIGGQKTHTVYSLMRHHNLIYCGTSSTSINVFDFTVSDNSLFSLPSEIRILESHLKYDCSWVNKRFSMRLVLASYACDFTNNCCLRAVTTATFMFSIQG